MNLTLSALAADIQTRATGSSRFLVAIAGAPGSGKSTLADRLAEALIALGERATVMPMDGFHMDNAVLSAKGLLPRKGAPETFDVRGFIDIVAAVRHTDGEVLIPVFDRSREIAIASARIVAPQDRIILIEGNYLLLNEAPWSALEGKFDFTIFLDIAEPVLEARLKDRWAFYKLTDEEAHAKIHGNDLPNGRRIRDHRLAADLVTGEL